VNTFSAPFRHLSRNPQSSNLNPQPETIWALKDISFEVKSGEVVGIIGRNGAGKTTLLKILSRITEPTEGWAEMRGRVGSLLEVGTGFHPELTGRENIHLNGAILGMQKGEINRKFDEIVAFAEIEKFMDTPVKRYSSGMRVRLAFAVAAHLEPEIMLVDEVLAVGDVVFQKKCLGKMGEVAGEGRTVLFVSHNMQAIQGLCQRVILLKNGGMIQDGNTNSVISNYMKTVVQMKSENVWNDINNAPGNKWARIHSIRIKFDSECQENLITTETPFDIEIEYWILKNSTRIGITLQILNEQGIVAFATGSGDDPESPIYKDSVAGLYRSTVHIPANLLNSGTYIVDLFIVKGLGALFRHEGIISFEVIQIVKQLRPWYGKNEGVVRPRLCWHTDFLDTVEASRISGKLHRI
jgi:lipopolysaccharide transport system ATP-binding protein